MMEKLYCPFCGGTDIHADLVEWDAVSTEDETNRGKLAEHQCETCGADFWTGILGV